MASDPGEHPESPRLLYPFYLDIDMSMAFSAALTGGVALEEELLDKTGSTSQAVKNLKGNLKLWRAGGFEAGRSATDKDEATIESRLIRRHTVASIFIDLYDELARTGQLLDEPDLAQAPSATSSRSAWAPPSPHFAGSLTNYSDFST